MKSSVLYDIIEAGEGKRDLVTTISRKMKRDIVDLFSTDKAKTFNCLELGFWRGHTTYILSHLFKTVTAIDINDGSKIIPEVLERDNVEFIHPMDIYDSNPDNVWRKLKDTYPEFNNDELRTRIESTADDIIYQLNPEFIDCNGSSGEYCLGSGMVDVYKAIGLTFSPYNVSFDFDTKNPSAFSLGL